MNPKKIARKGFIPENASNMSIFCCDKSLPKWDASKYGKIEVN